MSDRTKMILLVEDNPDTTTIRLIATLKAHFPGMTTAGQVGSSGLLVARREGDQQLDPTCLTAGPIGCPPDLNHEPGVVVEMSYCRRCYTNHPKKMKCRKVK